MDPQNRLINMIHYAHDSYGIITLNFLGPHERRLRVSAGRQCIKNWSTRDNEVGSFLIFGYYQRRILLYHQQNKENLTT